MGERTAIVYRGELAIPVRHAGDAGGETVILLHGFPQTSATWSLYLTRLAAAGYLAVAPDLRGYATSARPTTVDQYKLDHLVEDVVAVADDLGIERFHLVGHDWGGIIAWAFAAAHPDRLHGLTSVSMPHPRAIVSSLWRSSQLVRVWYVGFFQVRSSPSGCWLPAAARSSAGSSASTASPTHRPTRTSAPYSSLEHSRLR